ncbi:glycosyltransferase involved in cell wall biosynthesis [Novosphingobium kunmingense]|uniref:Glycosyltransferase involved in cell wall biosynthesis n=1 Tax=Novosphingobium kunmingense TaxID=1211806 RepID=A0A2N0H6P5_9SPHN|nr:glycosyltransferase family 4 protein [Novosphingobium kunmingense]PKB14608.1 glycosyltransferase involved in cell wall biosynthesis [Novosphingobium kunmingense]
MDQLYAEPRHSYPRVDDSPVVQIFSRPVGRPVPRRLSLALIGTYVPRKCGIATFTADVVEQLAEYHGEIASTVYALDDADSGAQYAGGVVRVDQSEIESYRATARQINEAAPDAVWLQHEFGIFGGPDGEMVCELIDRIAAPLVVTFHTVLSEPSANQRRIVEHLISRASRIMVMSAHGRDLLVDLYHAPADRVAVIPHGAPDRPFGREAAFKEAMGLAGRNVLMTFGLLGPGKGLEHAIEALPAIVACHPETVYRIVGATHPNLVAQQGEVYRERLVALAERLGVAQHIEWDNRFLETPELLDQLEACDVYLTPYPNLQQATSGTLSYAVALGKAVVSTPYVHARELLADGVGVIVEPHSSGAIAEAVNALLDDREYLMATRRRAYGEGRKTIWPRFADSTAALVQAAAAQPLAEIPLTATPGMHGVLAMCDGTGMLQHAIGIVPDRRHGYCLDDNARALILMNHAPALNPIDRLSWSSTFASFIQYAWNPDRNHFRNFMRFDRTWCEDEGSDDSNGRGLWALGDTAEHSPFPDLRDWARHLFDQTLRALDGVESPRAMAFGMLGACAVLRADGHHPQAEALIRRGALLLERLLAASRRPDWAWFEAVLGYDNPRLPQALIESGQVCGRGDWIGLGLATLDWIADRQIAANGLFRPVGSESFGQHHGQMPFDQQPLEAQAAIEAAAAAHAAAPSQRWVDHAVTAYRWFLGANDRGAILGDIASGRCRDGVTPRGANANCGAESILAFQLGYAALQPMLGERRTTQRAGDALAEDYHGPAATLAHP